MTFKSARAGRRKPQKAGKRRAKPRSRGRAGKVAPGLAMIGWGVALAADLFLMVNMPVSEWQGFWPVRVLLWPAQVLLLLVGRAAYVVPFVLVALGVVYRWHVHYIPRRRKTIRIVGAAVLMVCVYQGLGKMTGVAGQPGGLLGESYFNAFGAMNGAILGAVLAWVGLLAGACLLAGVNPLQSRGLRTGLAKGGKVMTSKTGSVLRTAGMVLLHVLWGVEQVEENERETKNGMVVIPESSDRPRTDGGPSTWQQNIRESEQPPWLVPVTNQDLDSAPCVFTTNPLFPLDRPLDIDLLPERDQTTGSGFPLERVEEYEAAVIRTAADTAGLQLLPAKPMFHKGLSTASFSFKMAAKQNRSVTAIYRIKQDLELALERSPIEIVIDREIRVVVPLVGDERTFAPIKPLLHDVREQAENGLFGLLGRQPDGSPLLIDFQQNPHWLVAGATGSGKSVGLQTILFGLVFMYTPAQVRLCVADHKNELSAYEDLPHLFHEPLSDRGAFMRLLDALREELDRRKAITDLSERAALPAVVTIVDEFHGFGSSDVLMQLVAEARAFGMHFILTTQHPTGEIIDTTIKANLVTRVAFKVANESASRLILGTPEARSLLGRGDALVRTVDGIERVQAGWVTTAGEVEESDMEWLQAYLREGPREVCVDAV